MPSGGGAGDDFPVWCRINGAELGLENGWTPQEALDLGRRLEKAGIHALSVSAFGYGKFSDTIKPERDCGLLSFARDVKKHVTVPVMTAGMISPAAGEEILRQGQADWIVGGGPAGMEAARVAARFTSARPGRCWPEQRTLVKGWSFWGAAWWDAKSPNSSATKGRTSAIVGGGLLVPA